MVNVVEIFAGSKSTVPTETATSIAYYNIIIISAIFPPRYIYMWRQLL